jgi:hypothetical protein
VLGINEFGWRLHPSYDSKCRRNLAREDFNMFVHSQHPRALHKLTERECDAAFAKVGWIGLCRVVLPSPTIEQNTSNYTLFFLLSVFVYLKTTDHSILLYSSCSRSPRRGRSASCGRCSPRVTALFHSVSSRAPLLFEEIERVPELMAASFSQVHCAYECLRK